MTQVRTASVVQAPSQKDKIREVLDAAILLLHYVKTECESMWSTPVKPQLNAPLNPPSNPAETLAEHRRNHRSGRPGKIDADPELRAFILARIDTLTFAEIVTEVAANFPPDRRVSHSSLHRWWQKHRGQLLAVTPNNRLQSPAVR